MAKEQFLHPETADLLTTLDEAARRSGVSRGQAIEEFLHMAVCALSGGRMEDQYLAVVKKHTEGKPGRRGVDSLAEPVIGGLSSTFAMFGVRGFITAFFSTTLSEFLNGMGDTGACKKSLHIEKGKRQSVAALQMKWQKSSLGPVHE